MNTQLANLDALRSFAVLCVFIDHLYATVAIRHGMYPHTLASLGHAGVLAFFVHTSLVLMFSLERLSIEHGRVWARFYLNRAFRIYPLSLFVVLLMFSFRLPPDLTHAYTRPPNLVLISNLLLVQNFIGKTSILSPLWSLPFEIDMYVVLPMVFWLANRKLGTVLMSSGIVFFSVLGWTVLRLTGHASLLAYIPCFLSGVMAYSISRKTERKIAAVLWPVGLIFWFGITSYAWDRGFGLLPTWLMCTFLGGSIYMFSDSKLHWWNAFTSTVAKYSYGIYLLHIPVTYVVFRSWKISPDVIAIITCISLTYVCAWISFYLLEEPLIQLGKRISARMVSTAKVRAASTS
jgi:peptidoglycan/LPS O-acetylase OafA/YrhL